MTKRDLTKEHKGLYRPSAKEACLVEVPPFTFLMIDGAGDPSTAPAYKAAVAALYALAYHLKFMVKKGPPPGIDYAVMPLEGLWRAHTPDPSQWHDRATWHWTMLIAQPEYVTPDLFETARTEVRKKKGLPEADAVRLETYAEGLVAQIMHIGPYSAEEPTIERLHTFIAAQGYTPRERHHEIYLKDPVRTAPERLETILRHPVAPTPPGPR